MSTSNLVIDPNLVPLFSQAVRVGMPDFSYVRDTRDNPIESLKGTFNTFDLGVASGIFGSQTNFTRVVVQTPAITNFINGVGCLPGLRASVWKSHSPPLLCPLPERFFAGGSTSHRGFGINQAGPRDLTSGFPLGGEALFLNNLDCVPRPCRCLMSATI